MMEMDEKQYSRTPMIVGVFCFLIAISPLFFMHSIVHLDELPKRLFLHPGLLFISSTWIVLAAVRKEPLQLQWFIVPILMLFVYALISLSLSANKYTGFSAVMAVSAWLYAWILTLSLERRHSCSAWIISALLMVGFITASVGIIQVWANFSYYPSVAFPGSTFMNRNYAAHVCVVSIPVALSVILVGPNRFYTIFCLIGSSTSWLYVLYTGCRAALLAAFFSVFLVTALLFFRGFLPKNKSWKRMAKRICCVLPIFIIIYVFSWYDPGTGEFVLGGETFQRIFQIISYQDQSHALLDDGLSKVQDSVSGSALLFESSSAHRLHGWKASCRMLGDFWLMGVGAGQFEVAYPPYDADGYKTVFAGDGEILRFLHNDYLQFFTEYGLLALFVAVSFLVVFVDHARTSFSWSTTTVAAYGGLSALLFIALFDGPFTKPVSAVLSAVLAGLALASYRGRLSRAIGSGRTSLWIQISLAIFGMLLGLFGLSYYNKRVQAEKAFHLMNAYWQAERPQRAIRKGLESVDYVDGFHKFGVAYGNLLASTGNFKEAKSRFKKVLQSNPHDYTSHLNSAGLNQALGETSQALEHYKKCLSLVPSDRRALTQCAQIYQEGGDFTTAEKYLQQFTNAWPMENLGYLMRANNFELSGNRNAAISVINQGLGRLPQDQALLEKLASLAGN